MTIRPRFATAALLVLPLLVAGCSGSEDVADGDGLVIATTVSPITSIAANIAGDRAQVRGIVPEGTNSHTYEPPPQVAELLSTADIVFVNGLKLEDPTLDLAAQNAKAGSEIVQIGDEVLPESDWIFDFSFPEEEGKPNPHLWTDPLYAAKYAEVIADTLVRRDPENASYYQANLAAFAAKVDALAAAVREDQRSVPEGGLKLLTYHDAYAYFAENFGWDVIGAVQPKNFSDPAPADVASLIDQVKAEGVPTIFGSEVFPSAVLEEIGRATGARYEDTLRDDDLPGVPGEAEHSYLGLMRSNFQTMITGLGGTADALAALDVADVATDQADYPQ
jgi:ABC-type Zn uptake system ZnuABC Zn-binding protein ZnuA